LKEAVAARAASGGGGEGGVAPGGDAGAAAVEYLYVEVPDPEAALVPGGRAPFVRLMHFIPPGARHPMQFAREILCRLANRPDRASWKECATGQEAETKQVAELREQFSKHDFTLAL
jgi:hypothetical protein